MDGDDPNHIGASLFRDINYEVLMDLILVHLVLTSIVTSHRLPFEYQKVTSDQRHAYSKQKQRVDFLKRAVRSDP